MSCSEEQATRLKGVAHIRMSVNNVDRSVKWYREVLGFEEPRLFGELAVLRHPDAESELVMRPRGLLAPGSAQQTFDHVAFAVRSLADLHAWEARLQALGLDVHIGRAIGGMSIDLLDPDGNDLELFVSAPES